MKNRSRNTYRPATLFFLIAGLLTVSISPAWAEGNQKRKVLVLHSYHQGFTWTDYLTQGIESVLKAEGQNVDLRIEYMDTKRISDEGYFQKLYELYKYKFGGRKFNVILSSDEDAYHFLLKYKDELFPGTPMVFCGVNYFKESQLAGHDLVTGVVEAADIKGTLEIALKLHPSTQQFVVISDGTTAGVASKKVVEELIPSFRNSVKFVFLENLDMQEVLEKVQNLPPDSLVLLLSFVRDKSGNVFSYEESTTMIPDKSKVPVYSAWDLFLGRGVAGGR